MQTVSEEIYSIRHYKFVKYGLLCSFWDLYEEVEITFDEAKEH